MPNWTRFEIDSAELSGNLLGDPNRRAVHVYLPPGVEEEPPSALVVLLHGYAQRADTWTWPTYLRGGRLRPSFGELLDGLASRGVDVPAVAVPDGWTGYGGGQWLDSPVHGNLFGYLVREVFPALHARFPGVTRERTGVVGYSSGGLGAWEVATCAPHLISAAALLSASANFELTALGTARKYLLSLGAAAPAGPVEGDETSWLAHALGAAYSPAPGSPPHYVDFPYDLTNGRLRPEVWERWRARDPVENVIERADALRALRLLLLDVGVRDEHGALLGHRALSQQLAVLDVPHVAREFDGLHSDQGIQRAALAVRDLAAAFEEQPVASGRGEER